MIHNTATSSLMLFELTCPLDSTNYLEQARIRKQNWVPSDTRPTRYSELLWDPWDQCARYVTIINFQLPTLIMLSVLLTQTCQSQIVSETDVRRCLKELHCSISEDFYGKRMHRVVEPCLRVYYLDIACYFCSLANFLPCHAHTGHFCNQLFCSCMWPRMYVH